MLVYSITLTQKRVRSSAWVILVLGPSRAARESSTIIFQLYNNVLFIQRASAGFQLKKKKQVSHAEISALICAENANPCCALAKSITSGSCKRKWNDTGISAFGHISPAMPSASGARPHMAKRTGRQHSHRAADSRALGAHGAQHRDDSEPNGGRQVARYLGRVLQ